MSAHNIRRIRLPTGTAFEPSRKGFRAFARRLPCQDIFNAHIFVQIRPMNAFTFADKPMVGTLIRGSLQ